MPLIVMQMKELRTDTNRMFDLHSDVFYQQDDSFSKLDYDDPKYRPAEFSKKRGQPINIGYDITIVTKYREDLDQILSNFAVHFRPDVYVRWWHPRLRDRALESQVTWGHSISYESTTDYNPQNVFMYKGTSSFTLRSWLFYGMNATDNAIDPALESVVKNIKIFPNRTGYPGDSDQDDDIWAFGDYLNTPDGVSKYDNEKEGMGFIAVDPDQDFIGDDDEQMKNGQYSVNNIYAADYPAISGDPVISKIHTNPYTGDMYTTNDRLNNYNKNQYQMYLEIDKIEKKNVALFKNVYFKGSFPEESFSKVPPSGDYMLKRFFKTYVSNPKAKAEFGDAYNQENPINIDYNIETKDFTIWSDYQDSKVVMHAKSKFNSVSGCYQEFSIESRSTAGKTCKYAFHKEYDTSLNPIKEKDVFIKENVKTIDEYGPGYAAQLVIEDYQVVSRLLNIKNIVKEFWEIINLQERSEGGFEMMFEDPKFEKSLKIRDLADVGFRQVDVLANLYNEGYVYQILCNRYLYIVLKINSKTNDVEDIYDFGVVCPLKYATHCALIYEVTIPESRELLGLNFYLSL
jgi:hypothetical protein